MEMKTIGAIALVVCLLGSAFANPGLVVFRGLDGKLTQESVSSLRELRTLAAREGSVHIWVDFDIPFQGNPDLRTPEVVAEEARLRAEAIREIIVPLERRRLVQRVSMPVETGAPGCLVNATPAGLTQLAKNPRVQHIGHLPSER
jgi:hypothetical protein